MKQYKFGILNKQLQIVLIKSAARMMEVENTTTNTVQIQRGQDPPMNRLHPADNNYGQVSMNASAHASGLIFQKNEFSNQQKHAEIKPTNQLTLKLDSIELPQDLCNLCKLNGHKTADCNNSKIYYHATDKKNLQSILKNGFIPQAGRLGKAVYVSDNPIMCIKFVSNKRNRFPNPILLKVKVKIEDNHIHCLSHNQEIKQMTLERFNKMNIKAIKCPYYFHKTQSQTKVFFEYALYKVDYAVTSWSNIKFPEPAKETNQVIKNDEKNKQLYPGIILNNKKTICKKQRTSNQIDKAIEEVKM